MKARFLKVARDELAEAARYDNAQSPGLGADFRDEVKATVERIKAFPEAWQSLDAPHRRCRTRRFPYGVIYRPEGETIIIVAVYHLHQRPGGWEGRG